LGGPGGGWQRVSGERPHKKRLNTGKTHVTRNSRNPPARPVVQGEKKKKGPKNKTDHVRLQEEPKKKVRRQRSTKECRVQNGRISDKAKGKKEKVETGK